MFEKYNNLMMTDDNINKIIPKKCDTLIKENNNNIKKNKTNNYNFITDKDDKLFWLFYQLIFKNDFIEKEKNFQREKEVKINAIEKIRENKDTLKLYKLKIIDIENELLNEKKITIKGFIALCLCYSIVIEKTQ